MTRERASNVATNGFFSKQTRNLTVVVDTGGKISFLIFWPEAASSKRAVLVSNKLIIFI